MNQDNKEIKSKIKRKCPYCHNVPIARGTDFCPGCGLPSPAYQKFIISDMEENGELGFYY